MAMQSDDVSLNVGKGLFAGSGGDGMSESDMCMATLRYECQELVLDMK